MLPDPRMMQGGAPPPGRIESPVKPGAETGAPDRDAMKSQLTNMLKQVKRVAEENGLDWNEIISSVAGAERTSSPTVPRVPSNLP